MCGIVGGFGVDAETVRVGMNALVHRGPDCQQLERVGEIVLAHTRLSILDPTPASNQPFRYGNTTISFNGEIWNHRAVRTELHKDGFRFNTTGDTEVLAAAIDEWGMKAFEKLQGMWAVAFVDGRGGLSLCRDRFGEIPLHYAVDGERLWFASERKALRAMGVQAEVRDLPPGAALMFDGGLHFQSWYRPNVRSVPDGMDEAAVNVRQLVEAGAIERSISDVPVCTLLSGGIDSSAVLLTLKKILPDITAYTAVMDPNSPDLKATRLLADELEVKLVEVTVPTPTANDLGSVVECIEMPFKAQVEIGWACIQLAHAMRSDGFKVTFSGEGSDELWASYGFAYHALKSENWHDYRRDLVLDQGRKNFARCNKIFMAASVECRLPFLHVPLVEYALRLKRDSVQSGSRGKAVMQEAFRGILPDKIVNRQKLAFQDGTGMKKAAAAVVANPRAFYEAEFSSRFGKHAARTVAHA